VNDNGFAELDQLRTLVERLPNGVLSVDRELTVKAANVAARRIFHPERISVGRRLPPLWFEPGLDGFVERLFSTKTVTQRYEVRHDSDHAFALTGVPSGTRETALLVIEDISVHERRAQAEREFIANAAHELLTPLTGIVGAAHALESGAKTEPELRDRFITHIARECNRLARIARGLLVLARAQSGEEPPRPDIIDLGKLLHDAADGAGSAGDVRIECPPGLTAFVDRDLAEQAFTNLIANARRHSGQAPVKITTYRSDEDVIVEIADEGTGYEFSSAPDERRFASSAGRDGGGFGLGLSIASQAVRACGGNLTITPRRDRGSVARVELPLGAHRVA
jgi:two-component system, OmpR family, sensor histidine kinase VicK